MEGTISMNGKRISSVGKFYGVGVGPGDPELLTLKAVRILKTADLLVIPGKDRESCTAYRIAVQTVPELAEKPVLPVVFPMTKDSGALEESHEKAAEAIAKELETGKSVAFLTIGDPTVYSTCLYVLKRLMKRGYEAEMISGVPSFCAAAAGLLTGLGEGDEAIHILAGSYPIEEGLALPGTKVLMKSGKQIGKVKQVLTERMIPAVMAENCGMPDERFYYRTEDIPEDSGYYSLVIVKEKDSDTGA